MKYLYKFLGAFVFSLLLPGVTNATVDFGVETTSTEATEIIFTITGNSGYTMPPFTTWNSHVFTIKYPAAAGPGLIAGITNLEGINFALDGPTVLSAGFYYQKFSTAAAGYMFTVAAGEKKEVSTIQLNNNGNEPEVTFTLVPATETWAIDNSGLPNAEGLFGEQFEGFTDESANALPIKLNRFTATKGQRSVTLDWSTSSELNGSHFDVQRSRDLDSWTTIGTVDAVGESSTIQEYQLVDKDLPLSTRSSKTFYYRLNMIDNDGASELSEVRTVRFDQDGADFIVYPNPSLNEVFVNLSSITTETGPATMNVINMAGERVKKVTLSTNDDISVDISNITAGVYYFVVRQGEETFSQKVIKID